MGEDRTIALADGFDIPSEADWRAAAEKALKGAPFEKVLFSSTEDGIAVKPLYTDSDLADLPWLGSAPGRAPFVRGAHAADGRQWAVAALVDHPDPESAGEALKTAYSNGGMFSVLRLSEAILGARAGPSGVVAPTAEAVGKLYPAGKLPPAALQETGPGIGAALLAAAYELAPDRTALGLGLDPLGRLAETGFLPEGLDRALAMAVSAAMAVETPRFTGSALAVSTAPYANAGATPAHEIACFAAAGVQYLRALETAGLDPAKGGKTIAVTLTANADIFGTIAKFRAARIVWARILEACGAAPADRVTGLGAESARAMLSERAPWVNALRLTAAVVAAGVAGANWIRIHPFTAPLGPQEPMADRLARNTQLILREESHLGRVADAAGGSYYLESLTKALAEKAWTAFQDIENSGGMAAALQSGKIAAEIERAATARAERVASQRDALTGVSAFPNLEEKTPPTGFVDEIRLAAAMAAAAPPEAAAPLHAVTGLANQAGTAEDKGAFFTALVEAAKAGTPAAELQAALGGEPTRIEPLPLRPLAADFEALRDAAEAAPGGRPEVLLLALGRPADFTARVTFARSFFEAGGFATRVSDPLDTPEAAAKAAQGAAAAVLCTSDGVLETLGAPTAAAVQGAGAKVVFIAAPPPKEGPLAALQGIHFIHRRADAIATLRALYATLGLKADEPNTRSLNPPA